MKHKGIRLAVIVIAWCGLIVFLWRALERLPSQEQWNEFFRDDVLRAVFAFSAFFALAMILRAFRFALLIGYGVSHELRKPALLVFPWLFFIGAITPLRLGEGTRAIWLRSQGGATSDAISYWAAERIADTLALLSLLMIGAYRFPGSAMMLDILPLSVFAALICVYLMLWLKHDMLARISQRSAIARTLRLDSMLDAFAVLRNPAAHASLIGLTVLIWVSMACAFYFSFNLALGPTPLAIALLAVAAVNIAYFVSAAPGNVGGYQAAIVAVLALHDLPADTAFMLGVALNSANLLITIVAGLASRLATAAIQRN